MKLVDRRLAKKIMAYRKYSNAQSRRFFRRHPELAKLNLAVPNYMPAFGPRYALSRHDDQAATGGGAK